jgi:Rod binding domain-containing protein
VDPVGALGIGRTIPAAAAAASAKSPGELGQIDKAAEGFEAIFLRQILHQFRASVSVDGESSSMTGLYSEMFDDQLAEHLAKVGGLGVKDVIRTYLERNGR